MTVTPEMHSAYNVLWTKVKDFGPVATSFLSFCLAYCVSRITKEQKEINKRAYDLNLFKERFAVYGRFKELYNMKEVVYNNGIYSKLLYGSLEKEIRAIKEIYSVLSEVSILFKVDFEKNNSLNEEVGEFLRLVDYFLEFQEFNNISNKIKYIGSISHDILDMIENETYKEDIDYRFYVELHEFYFSFSKKIASRPECRIYLFFIDAIYRFLHGGRWDFFEREYFSFFDVPHKDEGNYVEYDISKLPIIKRFYLSSLKEKIKKLNGVMDDAYCSVDKEAIRYFLLIGNILRNDDFFDKLIKLMEGGLTVLPYKRKTLLQELRRIVMQ